MVNFRYHLVSLVSVFIALAVGIVLGAGPLKGPIESGFADQITQLRNDKDDLRAQLSQAQAVGEYADQVFGELSPEVLKGYLTGRSVVVVTVGREVTQRSQEVAAGLEDAGAQATGRVHLEGRYLDATGEELAEAVTAVTESLDGGVAPPGDANARLGWALAAALTGLTTAPPAPEPAPSDPAASEPASAEPGATDPAASPDPSASGVEASPDPSATPTPSADSVDPAKAQALAAEQRQATAAAAFEALNKAGFVSGDQPSAPADAVVIVAGRTGLPDDETGAAKLADQVKTLAGALKGLVRLDAPVVVSGSAATALDFVAGLREEAGMPRRVSTVDSPVGGAEVITVLWALAAQYDGAYGAYGFGGRDIPVMPPALPAPVPSPSPSPSPTPCPPGTTEDPNDPSKCV
jgi:hypothetical protein